MARNHCTVCKANWGLAPFAPHISFRCPRCGVGVADPDPITSSNSLQHYLNHEGVLPIELVTPVVLKVMDILQGAHESGRMHGHLRPNLVIWNDNDNVAVLAVVTPKRWSDYEWESIEVFESPSSLGPVEYVAPEQLLARERIDHRVDIYSLGALLFHVLSGTPPFIEGSQLSEKMLNLQRGRLILTVADAVPPKIVNLCYKALSTKVHDRFQSIEEFRKAFQEIVGR